MTPIIEFSSPPLPYYILSGFSIAATGRKHPNRYQLGEFDLLVVDSGCLYLGEEERHYELTEGHALVLRPDLHHYPTEGCRVPTGSYWLHFQTTGTWKMAHEEEPPPAGRGPDNGALSCNFSKQHFTMRIPQFTKLLQPAKMYETLQQLNALEQNSHQGWARWKQQVLFQDVLEQLHTSLEAQTTRPGTAVADQAASFLRQHYRDTITAASLGEALNFHPVYIARCMQKEFGCSPMEYLLQYRVQQAKMLLLQTDLPVAYIAEEVGFNQAAYFTSCFSKYEGITPRTYRQRFSQK